MAAIKARTEKLDLRLSAENKQMLRAAADVLKRSVSEFVLESALSRAHEALADRNRFGLSEEKWAAFIEALDAPARAMPRMKELLTEPSIFER